MLIHDPVSHNQGPISARRALFLTGVGFDHNFLQQLSTLVHLWTDTVSQNTYPSGASPKVSIRCTACSL